MVKVRYLVITPMAWGAVVKVRDRSALFLTLTLSLARGRALTLTSALAPPPPSPYPSLPPPVPLKVRDWSALAKTRASMKQRVEDAMVGRYVAGVTTQ